MPLKVFGNPMSTCTRKVLCVLAEKKVSDFEFVEIDFKTGQHKSPEHVARQPFGQVPVLDDIDESGEVFRLFESRAIVRYLDEKLPGTKLTPADLKKKALMEQWISVESSDVTPKIFVFIIEYLLKPMRGGQTDQAVVDAAMGPARQVLDVIEAHLSKNEYMAGAEFSLADICNMPYFEYIAMTPAKVLIEERPHLSAWWKRVSERKSWKVATGKEKL